MIQFSLEKQEGHSEEGRSWYDTKVGIEKSLTSLDGFNRLVGERHQAGYKREERLNEFYVFGRYSLDTCGNCAKAEGKVPKDVLPDIPDVMTRDEFWQYIKEKTGEDMMVSFAMNGGNLPESDLLCPHCQKGWEIGNCHDVVVWRTHEVFPLTDFVGKTLGDVKLAYAQKTDAIYRMQPDILIRHDRFIDLSPKYPNPEADWQKGIVKNENGWVEAKDGITDEYIIQDGDEGFFNVWKYFHGKCNREYLAIEEERKFRAIFEQAGFKDIRMSSLPNGYCPCDHCAPWFNVKTEFGTIMIGWRKRVINIDWTQMYRVLKQCRQLPKKTFASLFEDEDVTKGDTIIHAWGWEKAQDYLGRIYGLVTAN